MNPIDPADLNYRLSLQLYKVGDKAKALRHVLMALEEAPRYRLAHRLLLKITDNSDSAVKKPSQQTSKGKNDNKEVVRKSK